MKGWRYDWVEDLDPDVRAILIEEINREAAKDHH